MSRHRKRRADPLSPLPYALRGILVFVVDDTGHGVRIDPRPGRWHLDRVERMQAAQACRLWMGDVDHEAAYRFLFPEG